MNKDRLLRAAATLLRVEAAEWRARDPKREGMGRDRAQHERIALSLLAGAYRLELAAADVYAKEGAYDVSQA